jgi:hypothetical protein
MNRRLIPITVLLIALLFASPSYAGNNDPFTIYPLTLYWEAQNPDLQEELRNLFPESEGYAVLGPIDPLFHDGSGLEQIFHNPRLVCTNISTLEIARSRLREKFGNQWKERLNEVQGFHGVTVYLGRSGDTDQLCIMTVNQVRWLIWAQRLVNDYEVSLDGDPYRRYAEALGEYLAAIDQGQPNPPTPKAADFDIPLTHGFYAPPPDYVIDGYQNYKDHLHRHAGIETDFAHGILAFIPTDSLLDALKSNAPATAFPNKEAPMLQSEYRKFFRRGGDLRIIQTLTKVGFDTLTTGEYFFAVGLNGTVRFGRELLREEVKRLEDETGRKVPRANHAFLFPGEPILTAGAFFVKRDSIPHLVEVNGQSGHYFYSNVTPTIREDISTRSNSYLLTLGHFFRALDRVGIAYEGILIRKL